MQGTTTNVTMIKYTEMQLCNCKLVLQPGE